MTYVVARGDDLNIEDEVQTSDKYSEPQLELSLTQDPALDPAQDFEEPLAKLRASMRLEEGRTDLFTVF